MTEIHAEALAIIGSGPAAWTAAIYAARANLNPVVFEGEPVGTDIPGGQLMSTTDIENFPGFPEQITGPELMERMRLQAQRFGVRVVSELITSVDLSARPFRIKPNYSPEVQAMAVVVATGAKAKWLGLPNELRLFSEDEIRALVAYVASLGHGPPVPRPHPERGSLSAGQKLFTDHCSGCHQVVAEGGYVTGAVAPPLENATATQVAQAIRIGPYVMPRFSTRDLSPHEVDSIVRYVEWAKHPDDRGGWAIGHIGPVPEGLVTWFLAATVLVAVCVVLGKRLSRE